MARIGRIGWNWDPLREMERMERDWSSIFAGFGRSGLAKFPPVNVVTSDNDAIVTSELPGANPEDIDISVTGDTLTIKGKRPQQEITEGQAWQRRERSGGSFYRTVQLPFNVDSSKVEADYTKGILKITLPRAESDKPKKVSIKAA